MFVSAEVFIVSSHQDAGTGSLQQAMTGADALSGKDTIEVNVSGTFLLETVVGGIIILGNIDDSLCILSNGIILETDVAGTFF